MEGGPRAGRRGRSGDPSWRGSGRPSTPAPRASCSTPRAARSPAAPAAGSAPTSRPRSRARSPSSSRRPRPCRGRRCAPRRSPRWAWTSRPAWRHRVGRGSARGKDPLAVALFVKRARAARWDRPEPPVAAHARPARARRGRRRRTVGDRPRLRRAVRPRDADRRARGARERLRRAPPRPGASGPTCAPCWRPTRAARRPSTAPTGSPPSSSRGLVPLSADPSAVPSRIRLYLKREDLAHTGAHKINNALGQALLTRRLGKTRVIAETGAGQHGVATATACALLEIPCVVYMGAEDIERQAAERRAHARARRGGPAGHERDRHPEGRRERGDARLGDQRGDDPLRPRVGDGPAPLPDDRPRPPARHRRRGGGTGRGRRGPPARPGDGLRRRRLERDRPPRPLHRRAVGPARRRRGGRRRDRHRAPRGRARRRDRRASSTAPAASCSRTATGRSSRRSRSRPGSTTRASGPQLAAL